LSGTGQDITDLKNAEYELKQSEEKFRSIVNSTDDSIYMVDRDYRYLFINNNHISRLGLPEGQYMNKAFSEFHSPEETRLFIKKIGKVFNTGNSFQYEFKSIRDDKYFLQTFSPVKNSNNEITAVNVISKEITAFKYAEERLYSMTITDELTGLYNRRGFLTLSDQQLKQANRDNKKMFLMSSDLDYLKLINDHLGHKAGDRALTNTANILKETFRESDVIARMGGDEFIVLGMVTPYYGIQTLTKRLKENLNVHNSLADEPLEDISLSFGFALYDPSQPCSIEELLTNADELMYIAKRKKR
jgi:diguanylate cyclase (GGDEF)-like protein/PAS domain S-box-containing protein